MPQNTLPLSLLASVFVDIAAVSAVTPTFNQGLIIGPTLVISSQGGDRLRQYNVGSWSQEMISDGFSISDPLYIAVGIYFSQSPAAQFVWVGVQDASALQTVTQTAGHLGTGFTAGDVVLVAHAGASGGHVTILTVDGSGVPLTWKVTPQMQGTGYVDSTGNTVTGGTGTGLEFDITAIGETPLQAVEACRLAEASWYAVTVIGTVVKADHLAIMAYAQSVTPQMMYHYTTADADALSGAAGNVFSSAKALSYSRALGIYSTTQGGGAPNNIYASAATMGVAMGLQTGLAGSYYTLMFKTLVGISIEVLTVSQLGAVGTSNGILGRNGNVYVAYPSYNIFQPGIMPNGQYYDEVINLDLLGSNIQFGVVGEFVDSLAVPLTNPGESQLIGAVNRAAQISADIGFIQPGTWASEQVLGLVAGNALVSGYLAQAESFTKQSPSDRTARKMMPIYLSIIEGQAGHSATIGVYVQR